MSDDPNLTSVVELAAANRPFAVPYPYETGDALLGSPFHPEEVIDGKPFDGPSAFDHSLASQPVHEYVVSSGREVWTEVRTADSSGVSQHLGVSGGAGVGCLCFKASAVVNYDSTTTDDTNVSLPFLTSPLIHDYHATGRQGLPTNASC